MLLKLWARSSRPKDATPQEEPREKNGGGEKLDVVADLREELGKPVVVRVLPLVGPHVVVERAHGAQFEGRSRRASIG